MFRPVGLFSQIACPEGLNCGLQSCLFKHSDELNSVESEHQYDPASVVSGTSRSDLPSKRKRSASPKALDDDVKQAKKPRTDDSELPRVVASPAIQPEPTLQHKQTPILSVNGKPSILTNTKPAAVQQTTKPRSTNGALSDRSLKPLQSQTRSISPPITNFQKTNNSATQLQSPKVEHLHPRKVQRDPVPFPTRVNCLGKLHKQIEATNKKILQTSPSQKSFALSEQEIIKQALDAEEAAANANSSSDGYKHMILGRITFFKDMSPPQWNVWVKDDVRKVITSTETADPSTGVEKIKTGLANSNQEVAIVKYLRSGLKQAEQWGYVLRRPTDGEVAIAKKHLTGPEECDRCGTHFQVFPGRNAEGKLTSKGPCRYHWARAPPSKFANNSVYDCCGAAIGSEGCTVSENHVYKVKDPARLAALWQFESSPAPVNGKRHKWPVTFDCEMCYTTKGMELVRVTAISWPEKNLLLDILVAPFGEILDLNTRFSGVSQQMYLDAPKYGTRAFGAQPQSSNPGPQIERVASPLAARQLLFDLIDTETPLIGHAIDNDLNACRIIHPFVIDTVIMYPHHRGLPARYKLKDLAKKYLNRIIQNNSEAGHDSREDSEATGDLVLVRVAEKWSEYKSKGWHWDGDVLITSSKKLPAKV